MMKLKISKTKLFVARTLRNVGIVVAVLMCLMANIITSYGLLITLVFAVVALALAGDQWIRSMYKCPKCENRLLPYRSRRGLEKSCPDYCPHCGTRIIVEITDE